MTSSALLMGLRGWGGNKYAGLMERKITYRFDFSDGKVWQYELCFDEQYRYITTPPQSPSAWTKLEHHQCSHCPLKKEDSPYCPIAQSLDSIVEDSKDAVSHTRAQVTVTSSERTYVKACDTQEGLRSLFGLLMATSGCPHLDWLRPLARFHLPFASPDENLFRVLSLQCVENFLAATTATRQSTDKQIKERYDAVEVVNHCFIKRINSYCQKDADKNALATLDALVQIFSCQLETDFKTLRSYFISEQQKS